MLVCIFIARSKAWICGRSFIGIAGSNPAWGMDICVLVLRVVRWRSLRPADHSSWGVLAIVVRRCVWPGIMNEEVMARVGPQRHGKEIPYLYVLG